MSNYGGHPVAFGAWFWGYSPLNGAFPGLYKQVWMAKNSSEKCIIWDATVDTEDNAGWAFRASGNILNDQYWWGCFCIDAPGLWQAWTGRDTGTYGNNPAGLNGSFAEKPNNRQGGGGAMDTYRFRHKGNTAGNFLFGDGHVETRIVSQKVGTLDQGNTDLIQLNFCVPYPVAGLVPQP